MWLNPCYLTAAARCKYDSVIWIVSELWVVTVHRVHSFCLSPGLVDEYMYRVG